MPNKKKAAAKKTAKKITKKITKKTAKKAVKQVPETDRLDEFSRRYMTGAELQTLQRTGLAHERELQKHLQQADGSIVVSTKEQFDLASSAVIRLGDFLKHWEQYWKDPIAMASELVSALRRKRDDVSGPVKIRRDQLRAAVRVYLEEEESRARIERARQEDAARIAAEKKAKALEAAAEKAAKEGETALVEAFEEEIHALRHEQPPVIADQSKSSSVTGGTVSLRQDVEVELVDLKLFLAEVIAERIPDTAVQLAYGMVKTFVRTNQIQEFPGLSIKWVKAPAFRGKG